MIKHIDIGYDDESRRHEVGRLIRTGKIRFGGYMKGKIYGTLNCSSGKRLNIENRVFFASEEEAIQAGYRPCGHCMPEKHKQWKAKQIKKL